MTAAQPPARELDSSVKDEDDLFDAVLTGSVDKETNLPSKPIKIEEVKTEDNVKPKVSLETPKVTSKNVFIGKFPWWITQDEVMNLINLLGVRDIIEIRFAENKVNGLSKGYAKVALKSGASVKVLMDNIPKCKLGGESITCCEANRHSLSLFEEMSQQSVPGFPPRADPSNNMNETNHSPQSIVQSTVPQQFVNTFPSIPNPFLRYPPPPLPYMPPMFMNCGMSVPNLQAQNQHLDSAVAGTSQERNNSSTSHHDEKIDKEFADLVNRNRAVASAAINKAVSEATTGDLRVAMETLLTAISIIKQSRVYHDDRCQALVTSLKDCLISIQGSFGYSRSFEEKECDRRKSSSSERRHSSRRDREKSWSRERSRGHSRERSRDRDRHRDRDRDRDRDRERYGNRDRGRDRY